MQVGQNDRLVFFFKLDSNYQLFQSWKWMVCGWTSGPAIENTVLIEDLDSVSSTHRVGHDSLQF